MEVRINFTNIRERIVLSDFSFFRHTSAPPLDFGIRYDFSMKFEHCCFPWLVLPTLSLYLQHGLVLVRLDALCINAPLAKFCLVQLFTIYSYCERADVT